MRIRANVLTDQMAREIHAFDWSATALGPLDQWPQCQRSALLTCLAARVPMALWLGPDLVLCYNDAWRSLLGAGDPALGRPGRTAFSDRWAAIGAALEEVYATGRATLTQPITLAVGRSRVAEERAFTWFIVPIYDEAGEVAGLSTALSEAEPPRAVAGSNEPGHAGTGDLPHDDATPLRDSQHFLRRLTETVPNLIYIYDLAANRNIYANRQVGELLGYTPEEARDLGADFLPTVIHPEDWAATPEHIRRLLALGDGEVLEREYRMRRRDGGLGWFYGREMVFARGPDGKPVQLLGSVLDITQHRETEAALRTSKANRDLALQAASMGTWDWDLLNDTYSWDATQYAIFGVTPDQFAISLESIWAATHPDDRERLQQLASQALATGEPYRSEFRIIRPDGEVRWCIGGAAVTHDAQGQPVRMAGITYDVTERKQAEERLGALQDVTASFAAAQTLADVRAVILREVTRALGADAGTVHALSGGVLALDASTPGDLAIGEDTARAAVVPLPAHHPAAEAARAGEGVFITRAEELTRRYPDLALPTGRQDQAGAHLPLKRGSDVFGVLSLHFTDHHAWDTAERAFALALADRASVAYERARLFDAIQASEARFRTLVQTTAQIIWTARPNGEFAGRQPSWEQFTGQRPEEYAASGGFSTIHPDDRPTVLAHWRRAIDSPATFEAEYRLRRYDGAYRHVRVRATPIRSPDGAVVEWVGVAEDRTEQRQRELNALFLDEVSQELTRLVDDDAIMRVTSAKIASYLGVWRCQFAEYDIANGTATVSYDWSRGVQTHLRLAAYQIAAYLHSEVVAQLVEGRQFVVDDITINPATVQAADQFARLEVGALVITPYRSDGRWEASLSVHDRAPRAWGAEELELLRELAERIWSRIERARAEAALQEREAQLAAFMENSPGSLFIKDGEGRYQVVNHAFLISAGKTADEVIGKTDAELFSPELARVFTEEDREVRASGEPRHFEDTFVYAGRTYTFLSQKFPLPNGGIGSVGTDITERKRAEEQLTTANYRFRLAEEAAKGFNYEWNLETGVVTRSESITRVLGYPPQELGPTWQAWSDLIHPDDARIASEQEAIGLVRSHGDTVLSSEYRIRHRDGHYVWVLERALTIRDERGDVRRVVGQTVDITERKAFEAERERVYAQERAARAQAEEASRLKDEFLATVSHELRTPLTAFLGYAQLLQARRRDEAYVARTVEKMVRSAKAQAQLIDDLLDISRIVSGKLRLDPAPVDLPGVIRAALDTVRPAAEAKALAVHVELDLGPGDVIGDPNRLQQVVWNLLANAVKFTPPGGALAITAERDAHGALLTVTDTGQGIDPEFLPYVFDRFRQADGTTNRAHGGLGIGLAIVRHLVELHGGRVEAESRGEGQGATFRVRLPLAPDVDPNEAAGPSRLDGRMDEPCPPELAGLRVLVVDDQPELLEVIADMLTLCDADVRLCGSAREALEVVRSWQPEVLVSDIAMPAEDGYWLIEQVRALPPERGGAVPAAALTAYVRVEDRLRVLAAGFDLYVPKPVEPAELRGAVAKLARMRRSEH
jgi:PAS domain S-box-containing protein